MRHLQRPVPKLTVLHPVYAYRSNSESKAPHQSSSAYFNRRNEQILPSILTERTPNPILILMTTKRPYSQPADHTNSKNAIRRIGSSGPRHVHSTDVAETMIRRGDSIPSSPRTHICTVDRISVQFPFESSFQRACPTMLSAKSREQRSNLENTRKTLNSTLVPQSTAPRRSLFVKWYYISITIA